MPTPLAADLDRTAALPLAPVEQSRADFYGLIATLLLHPPDAALLALLGDARTVASPHASPFERAWLALVDKARATDARAVAREHARLCVADAGEDGLGSLCEAMRLLIAGAPGLPRQGLERQRHYFETRVASGAPDCIDAIRRDPHADFYARLADFIDAFFAVEAHAFAIDDEVRMPPRAIATRERAARLTS